MSIIEIPFHKMSWAQRLSYLKLNFNLTDDEIALLKTNTCHDLALAETMIENSVSYFGLPLGLVKDFLINGKNYCIPMAIEETSVVAALNKTRSWIMRHGTIQASSIGNEVIGQIQIAKVKNIEGLQSFVTAQKEFLIDLANQGPALTMANRGGGLTDIELRTIARPDGGIMAVIHLYLNVIDAMGANIVNQVCEFLKHPIEKATGEHVTMCILSNLNDRKLTKVTITLENIDAELAEDIAEASLFAQLDPYRATTNNKGIMNGIDAVLVATGNDWRAVEAGLHAYSARSGNYKSLSTWHNSGTTLTGTLTGPVSLGVVGGVTKIHPIAQIAIKLLNVHSAFELSQVVASVGLTQNLGALRALVTEGIVQGHMKLHVKNIIQNTDATIDEQPLLADQLHSILTEKKYITTSDALIQLQHLRKVG